MLINSNYHHKEKWSKVNFRMEMLLDDNIINELFMKHKNIKLVKK